MKYEELEITNSNNSYSCPIDVKYINPNKHKVLKNSIFGMVFLCLFTFNVLFIMDAINTPFTNKALYTIQSIFKKPTDELFDDGSEVFFVNWLLNIPVDDGKVEFVSPVKHSNYTKSNGTLVINNAGKVVYATERGKISKLEYNDSGYKYMEITHPSGYVSCYNNLDFVGVVLGDSVTSGQLLGSSEGDLEFSIQKNNNIIDIDINGGVIVLNE